MDDPHALDRYNSRRSTVYAPAGVVATSQPLAAAAGLDMLRSGGNAFDAAVATSAALTVVEATSSGVGGDAFALYRTADGEVGAMRSCGAAPTGATIEAVRNAVAETEGVDPADVTMPRRGVHTVTVPGAPRGWEALVDRFARLPFDDLLAPAVTYARDGFPTTEIIARSWHGSENVLKDPHAREAFLVDDRAPRAGETMRLPQLGESLRRIGERGADVIYEGEIADEIVEEIRAHGGSMTREDLATHRAEFVDPVSTTYNGAKVFELPPNNQGLIALETLNIAEALGAGEHPYDAEERIHYFVEAMKIAYHDGYHYITDPAFEDVPPLGSKAYARQRAGEIGERAAADVAIGDPASRIEDEDTVLLTAADAAGNVVSLINSRFSVFGSGIVAGESGIALQNRGKSFSLDPDHPNRLEPGKRPFHTLIPAVACLDADDWLGFGVMGGSMQPQGHVQVLSNLLDYDMSLQAALDAPRWRYRASGTLNIDARTDEFVQYGLRRRRHDLNPKNPRGFGGAQAVRFDEGTLSAATEPRKDGVALGY